ncbi:unnamed protein product [Rotaria sp. Silwood2]|nr:unnamed protein product [Rotaria sp. Silwood2]CAF3989353.1 unnamed protein product [Rotaria sp. Silwood2]CAF4091902.1 unnamed protein product [Rotaria sp. Silwood2]
MSDLDVGIIKQEILSLLVSAKNGLSEYELLNDYRLFNSNKELPYRDLGYSSLITLLRSWPDVCRFQQQGNNVIKILAVEEESTKHILSMVKGQRSNKSRRRGRGGRNRARGGETNRNYGRDNRGARFLQNTINANNNRSGGNSRGISNGRMAFSNNRFERSTAPFRSIMGQSNQNSRNKPNVSAPPRFTKQQQQQQQIRSYVTGSSQPRMSSYELRQSINSNFVDDRRVINNSTSLQITVANNTNNNRTNNTNNTYNDYQYSSDTQFQVDDYALNEDDEQYDEDDDDKEEEAINNLRTLLVEYSHGIRLLSLDELYQKKFGKSLLTELKIANVLLLQDFVDDFASISRHGEENGSCDHIITLKDPKQVAQTQSQLLQQITDSGIVSKTFRYATNLFSYINDRRFQGFISDIDKTEHCLHVQPVRYQEHIETLMEELHSYYSSSISNSLIVNNIEAGLSCVTTYDGIYHRAFIKESDLYKCVIIYVDYGTTKEVNKDEQQFKYLLKHFAELPCMAIACRLDDISFIPNDNNLLPDTYNEIYTLCKDGPLFIEPTGYMNGLLTIRILDADEQCLNDIVVQLELAVKISSLQNNYPINNYEQEQQNTSKPVELKFDFLTDAAQCPLPDSGPSTPESNTVDSNFKLPENKSAQIANNSSNVKHQCKLIQIDEHNSFYLIRYNNNKPYIPCFNLAHLLHLSESDVLSETLLSRIRLQNTTEYSSIFDFLKQTNSKDCLHIQKNLLFLFDPISTLKYIERLDQINNNVLIEILRQQINASNEADFWNNVYDYYKPLTIVPPSLSVQSSNQTASERYNKLLTRRRNILCNMLRTDHVTECTLELTSIENELEQLVQKMRLGAISQQNSNVSLTPPSLTVSIHSDQTNLSMNKTDKLKVLMERCKTLINTILVLDDFVPVDDNVTKYIENNLPFLHSGKTSSNDDQLYKQYSNLFENLTHIVDDLRQKLPASVQL